MNLQMVGYPQALLQIQIERFRCFVQKEEVMPHSVPITQGLHRCFALKRPLPTRVQWHAGKLTGGELWNPKWPLSQEIQGMDMNFGLDDSGNGMNMNLGPMKFKMYLDEGRLSESRFFLGIDRSW